MPNSPLSKSASESVCWNFKLLAHHELGGFGGMGEGMAIQVAKDGRRIMWLAHESAPKNFTGVEQGLEIGDDRIGALPHEIGRRRHEHRHLVHR